MNNSLRIRPSRAVRKHTYAALMYAAGFYAFYAFLILLVIFLTLSWARLSLLVLELPVFRIFLFITVFAFSFTGLFILYFLLKFNWSKSRRTEHPGTEITAQEQPELFAIIQGLANELGVRMPRRIYLTPDDSCKVVFSSKIWHVPFPMRGDVYIGLGLMHSLSKQEFKAVIAHEFGHLVHPMARLGSFVQHITDVLHKRLEDDQHYNETLETWASSFFFFRPVRYCVNKANEVIKKFLIFWSNRVHEHYWALSRELEYFSDEVAATYAGSISISSALLHIHYGSYTLHWVQSFHEKNTGNPVTTSSSLYQELDAAMRILADWLFIPIENGRAHYNGHNHQLFNPKRLIQLNAWDSHPAIESRLKQISALPNTFEHSSDESPAISIVRELETCQLALSRKLRGTDQKAHLSPWSEAEYEIAFRSFVTKNLNESHYHSYYATWRPPYDDQTPITPVHSLADLYTAERVGRVVRMQRCAEELEQLEYMRSNANEFSTFLFDHQRHPISHAASVIAELQAEHQQLQHQVLEQDRQAFFFFKQKATLHHRQHELISKHTSYTNAEKAATELWNLTRPLFDTISFFYTKNQNELILERIKALCESEDEFKTKLEEICKACERFEGLDEMRRWLTEEYIPHKPVYFVEVYIDKDIVYLQDALSATHQLIQLWLQLLYNETLSFQIELAE